LKYTGRKKYKTKGNARDIPYRVSHIPLPL